MGAVFVRLCTVCPCVANKPACSAQLLCTEHEGKPKLISDQSEEAPAVCNTQKASSFENCKL